MQPLITLIEQYLLNKDYENSNDKLVLMQQLLNLAVEQIEQTSHFEEASIPFNALDDLQMIYSKITFENTITVTPPIKTFIFDFDRLDDPDTKKSLYLKIKMGNYLRI